MIFVTFTFVFDWLFDWLFDEFWRKFVDNIYIINKILNIIYVMLNNDFEINFEIKNVFIVNILEK